MTTETKTNPTEFLVIGYGNTLRGDDGVGPRVAEAIEKKGLAGVKTMAEPLLAPELADPVSRARWVVFVDAAVDAPREVQLRKLEPAESSQLIAHAANPATLLAMARDVFGHTPEAWLLTIPVESMEIGEKLSQLAKSGAREAVCKIKELVGPLTMDVPAILRRFAHYDERWPGEALAAAVAQREAITPELLEVLRKASSGEANAVENQDDSPLMACYLLAEFREKRAFPDLVRICKLPDERIEALLGETITAGLPSILASVFDGDLESLLDIIFYRKAYEFARGSAVEAVVLLGLEGIIPREAMIETLRRVIRDLPLGDGEELHPWNALACAIVDADLAELATELPGLYERKQVDPSYAALEDLQQSIKDIPAATRLEKFKANHHLITSARKETSWWAAFDKDDADLGLIRGFGGYEDMPAAPTTNTDTVDAPVPLPAPSTPPAPAHETIRREEAKVGRNDPCPCGSGKKYKKCCLDKE
jgi:hydrogenase maturation protease